nr:unnamed protein product [Digitaria exilis]
MVLLPFPEKGLEFSRSRPDSQAPDMPAYLGDKPEADLRLGNRESQATWSVPANAVRPLMLKPGARHVLQPSASGVYQESPWPVHSATPILGPGEQPLIRPEKPWKAARLRHVLAATSRPSSDARAPPWCAPPPSVRLAPWRTGSPPLNSGETAQRNARVIHAVRRGDSWSSGEPAWKRGRVPQLPHSPDLVGKKRGGAVAHRGACVANRRRRRSGLPDEGEGGKCLRVFLLPVVSAF